MKKMLKKMLRIMIILSCCMNTAAFAENTECVNYTVIASALNVREYGSLEAPVIDVLYRGDVVSGDNLGHEWVEISYKGNSAYVSREWITPTANVYGGSKNYLGRYYITGYDVCYSCNGNTHGITASGTKATVGKTVAMQGLPFGTKLYIEGIGYRIVEDRGCKSGVIDVLCNNHSECYQITAYREVYIVK